MKASFWHDRWESNQIAFHEGQVNVLLAAHFERLALGEGQRIFIPLCGKTRDIAWLLAGGYDVVGAELSELAIEALFDELGVVPNIHLLESVKHYQAPNIDIFVGDIFELTNEMIGNIDAVYDRAALVALPQGLREKYSTKLIELTQNAAQLLITFTYDQTVLNGPPFSVSNTLVETLYSDVFNLTKLETCDVVGGLKGKVPATESVWLLTPHS